MKLLFSSHNFLIFSNESAACCSLGIDSRFSLTVGYTKSSTNKKQYAKYKASNKQFAIESDYCKFLLILHENKPL